MNSLQRRGADQTLRERKKHAARTQIVAVADRMFVTRGFDEVILDDVAAECDLSVRTVLRYFDTKEALALAHEYAALDRFRTGLLASDRGDVTTFWRLHVEGLAADVAARPDWYRQRYGLLGHSALYRRFLAIQREYQMLLAAALAAEATVGDHHLAAELYAVALVVGIQSVLNDWLHDREPFDPARLLEAIDYARDLFSDGDGTPPL
jgi:AcrR family transcriptional regulator